MVLERLQRLQAELAALDPSRDLDVADKVASIASTFRDALASVDDAVGQVAEGPHPDVILSDLRRAG